MRGIRGLVAGVFLGLCAVAPAQDGSLFLEQWEEAKTVEGLPDGIYLELVFKTSPANIQVGPGEKVPDAEQRIRLWWESEDLWRLAHEKPGFAIEYHDAAWSDESEAAWMMTSRTLIVVDPHRLPEGANPSMLVSHLPLLWQYWTTGVAANSPLRFEPVGPAHLRPDRRWVGRARSAEGDRITSYEGVVSPDNTRLLVEQTATRRVGTDGTNLGGNMLSGWRRDPLSPTGWLPTQFTQFGPDDEFVQSFRIVALRPLREDDRIHDLVAVPGSDASDPVRGPVTFRSIKDHRRGRGTVTTDGITTPMPTTNGNNGSSLARVVGWLAVAGLVFALIFVRLRMHRA
ncbi:MAG: hypothetical protein ACIARR_05490 [Phycisphaerales bacterium JB059]